MDPAVYMQGKFCSFTLGSYLGWIGTESPEEKEHCHRQGVKLLELYGVVPTRDTAANCPDCGEALTTMTDRARFGWRYACRNHPVLKKFSPLHNTFLQQARLNGEMSAGKIVMVIYSWLTRVPLMQTHAELSMSSDTVVFWYGFCRDVACAIAWHDYVPIGGAEDVVEVDETHFKRKYNVGRMLSDLWVLGGISRTTKKRFAMVVPRRNEETLMPILEECVDVDSYICTDSWLAYGACGQLFSGHGRVNHSENFIYPPRREPPIWMPPGRFHDNCLDKDWNGPPPQPGEQPFRVHTQNIERSWRDLKSHLRTSSSVEYTSQYIGEWMYRRNTLDEYGTIKEKFIRFLQDVRRAYPGVGKKPMKHRREELMDCDCHECDAV